MGDAVTSKKCGRCSAVGSKFAVNCVETALGQKFDGEATTAVVAFWPVTRHPSLVTLSFTIRSA
jgi:hypothetical protein